MNLRFPEEQAPFMYAWHCEIVHDFVEPEGTVVFDHTPEVGEEILLPSSGFTSRWCITAVRGDSLTIVCEEAAAADPTTQGE